MPGVKSIFEKGTIERALADLQLSNYTGSFCPICGYKFDTSDNIRERNGRKGIGTDLVCTRHWNEYAEKYGILRII